MYDCGCFFGRLAIELRPVPHPFRALQRNGWDSNQLNPGAFLFPGPWSLFPASTCYPQPNPVATLKNQLYYGDNLEVLKMYVKDESVDLVYLDPPFNSRQDYNVLFAEKDGSQSSSQIHAFEDTWEWNLDAQRAYEQIVEQGGRVADALRAFKTFLFNSDMMAYLAMMAPRLVELRRVLKQTGSIYLHCDPTASHYLKILMDAVFGPEFYRNEITWKRRPGMSSAVHDSVRFGICTDIILFYTKSNSAEFHVQYNADSPEYKAYVEKSFKHIDTDGRRFQATSLTNPAYRPNLIYEYKGYPPPERLDDYQGKDGAVGFRGTHLLPKE